MTTHQKGSSTMKIRIYDVGRARKSTTIDVAEGADSDVIAVAMYREVKRMGALASRGIECTWNSDSRKGYVTVGGFRVVGQAEVVL